MLKVKIVATLFSVETQDADRYLRLKVSFFLMHLNAATFVLKQLPAFLNVKV